MSNPKISSNLSDYLASQKQIISNISNNDIEGVLSYDDGVLMSEFDDGPALGEYCGIFRMKSVFAWKKTFQNVWTGFPNSGKTEFTIFMMVCMSLSSGWKWCVWSPEMKSANYVNGKVQVNYNDIVNQIIWIVSGKTTYEHAAKKHGIERISRNEYLKVLEWVKVHFIFIDPKDRTTTGIFKVLDSVYQDQGYDGVFIDPFKSIKQEVNKRDDLWLEDVFSESKEFSVVNNISFNWVAHPRSNVQRIKVVKGHEILLPCDQWMLNGGAAWNNSMDGIYSNFRPNELTDIRSTEVQFLNLKQRKQDLVAERGTLYDISFDIRTRRYLFNDSDPIDKLLNPTTEDLPF